MTDFLLELRSEEIPARMQARARDDLARLFAAELDRAGLHSPAIVTFATPRRLALIARDLPDATAAVSEEVKGPRTSAPPQALDGFLRKTGLTREQLTTRDGVLFAVTQKPGRATTAVLADAVPAIIRAFPWPKSMRWGDASLSTDSLRWVRPLHGIVALFGEEIVPVEIAGVVSGAATLGHRFHHPGPITIGSASDYVEKLHACHVIVDPDERARLIRTCAAALAQEAGLELVEDEGLVAENAGLTEWPVPLLGRFDEAFLTVPPEVIQLTARVNQKYFVCRDAEGSLANAFICTANIDAADGGARIVEGNRKVLAARLADARFFYEGDLKVPLEEQAKKLDRIVFHEKLGTVADKVDRVAKLARWLVEEGIVGADTGSNPVPATTIHPREGGGPVAVNSEGEASPHQLGGSQLDPRFRGGGQEGVSGREDRDRLANLAERAARLCKADLVTGMVAEFPELQGVMGGYYARAQGEPDAIADAIRDHYKPVGQGDDVPTAPVTVAVSLADKLDTLFAFFAIAQPPTGSKDPFALRRQMLSVAALAIRSGVRLPLTRVFEALGAIHQSLYGEWMSEWVPGLEDRAAYYTSAHRALDKSLFEFWERAIPDTIERFLASVPEHSDEPDDGYVRSNQARRIGSMHRAFASGKLILDDWNEVEAISPQLIAFAGDRLKVQQREAGVRHDLIDAVFALGGEDDLVRLLARVRALQAFVGTPDGANLLTGYRRAANILKKEGYEAAPLPLAGAAGGGRTASHEASRSTDGDGPPPTPPASGRGEIALSYTPEPAETALHAALDSAEPAAADAVAREDFAAAMTALASLRAPIDQFFEAVTVNDPDPAKRAARLQLLARVRDAVHTVADFSKIEG